MDQYFIAEMIKGNYFEAKSLTQIPKHVSFGLICYNFSPYFIINIIIMDINGNNVRANCVNISKNLM